MGQTYHQLLNAIQQRSLIRCLNLQASVLRFDVGDIVGYALRESEVDRSKRCSSDKGEPQFRLTLSCILYAVILVSIESSSNNASSIPLSTAEIRSSLSRKA